MFLALAPETATPKHNKHDRNGKRKSKEINDADLVPSLMTGCRFRVLPSRLSTSPSKAAIGSRKHHVR